VAVVSIGGGLVDSHLGVEEFLNRRRLGPAGRGRVSCGWPIPAFLESALVAWTSHSSVVVIFLTVFSVVTLS
jgi:hypothetical protein